jgi:hypothetical protein
MVEIIMDRRDKPNSTLHIYCTDGVRGKLVALVEAYRRSMPSQVEADRHSMSAQVQMLIEQAYEDLIKSELKR